MGASSSTEKNDSYKQKKHYTNAEIEDSIRRIFINSRIIDNTSIESLGWNDHIDVQEGQGLPSNTESDSAHNDLKDRYSKYNINNILPKIQDGGNIDDILNEVQSDIVPDYSRFTSDDNSEFDKIKEHMLNSIKGNTSIDLDKVDQEHKPNIINLFGGSNFSIEDEKYDDVEHITETATSVYSSSENSTESEEDDDDIEDDTDEDDNDEEDDKKADEEVDENDEDDEDEDDSDRLTSNNSIDDSGFATSSNESTISVSTYKSSINGASSIGKNSVTDEASISNKSSSYGSVSRSYERTSNNSDSVNIKPFSSTDTADYTFRHPYSSNRFR